MTPTIPSIAYWAVVLLVLPILGTVPFYLRSMRKSKAVLAHALVNPDSVDKAWIEATDAGHQVRLKLTGDHTAHVVAYNDYWEKAVADLRAAGVVILEHDEL